MAERRVGNADEATLVRAVADGSEAALAALYDRHVDGVHAVALRLTSDRQVAEEVVQETFLALWNRAELFDPAIGVARDVAADDRPQPDRRPAAGRGPPPAAGLARGPRGRGRARGRSDRLGPATVVIGGAVPDPGPEAAAEAGDLRAAVGAALAEMPEPERAVIVLAYREGLTQAEIAERLDWPLGTVKTRTRRALAPPAGRPRRGSRNGRQPGGVPRDGW